MRKIILILCWLVYQGLGGMVFSQVSSSTVVFSWTEFAYDPDSGITGYYLQVKRDDGYVHFVGDVGNVMSYAVSGLQHGRTYYARVKAINGSGVYSDWTTTSNGVMASSVTVFCQVTTVIAKDLLAKDLPQKEGPINVDVQKDKVIITFKEFENLEDLVKLNYKDKKEWIPIPERMVGYFVILSEKKYPRELIPTITYDKVYFSDKNTIIITDLERGKKYFCRIYSLFKGTYAEFLEGIYVGTTRSKIRLIGGCGGAFEFEIPKNFKRKKMSRKERLKGVIPVTLKEFYNNRDQYVDKVILVTDGYINYGRDRLSKQLREKLKKNVTKSSINTSLSPIPSFPSLTDGEYILQDAVPGMYHGRYSDLMTNPPGIYRWAHLEVIGYYYKEGDKYFFEPIIVDSVSDPVE